MKRKPLLIARSLMPLLLPMLVSACAGVSQPLPPVVVPPPAIPPLPEVARQPTPPPICSPTCSAGLMRLRTELLNMLTQPTSPAEDASERTTR